MNRFRFYTGLFLLTFATLMLEVIQTRLLSVMTWYHLAFFVISAAMFGMTAGAVWVYIRRDQFTGETLFQNLTSFTSGFAVTTALSLFVEVTLAPVVVLSATTVIVFAELALIMATPFFFSGVAVSLALTRSPFPIGRVYAADLAGASLGCLGVLGLLNLTNAPSAILWIGVVAAIAAHLFKGSGANISSSKAASHSRLKFIVEKPLVVAVVLCILALLNGITYHGIQPILIKDNVDKRSRGFTFEKWNYFSRISTYGRMTGAPTLWGPSPMLPKEAVTEEILLTIDGLAGTNMFRFDGDISKVDFLKYDLTNLAYFIRNNGRSAVIGVGSGRDVLSAYQFGFRDITGVEINPIFIDLLTHKDPFKEFAGLSEIPGIRFQVDEARSWFTRTKEQFDLIQMSMIDTWAATGAGAFTLTENGLYTLEAWQTLFDRLKDYGVFTVSRWYGAGTVNETGRMVSLAVATLLKSGIPDPKNYIFLAAGKQIATMILSRSPLSLEEMEILRKICWEYKYTVLLAPDGPPATEVLGKIVSAPNLSELYRYTSHLSLDLTPPTDNRPFFFNLLPLTKPHMAFKYAGGEHERGVVFGNIIATFTLVNILFVSFILVLATIVIPLRPAIREVGLNIVAGGSLYFGLLGLGFMLVEIGLLQRLSVFLGHPVYSLSLVLFSLILATGIGSFISEKVNIERISPFAVWSVLLGSYLLALPFWLPEATKAYQSSNILIRAFLSVGVITPAGLMMGFGFPTGMRIIAKLDKKPLPWFWGINGAMGVLASVMAVALSIAFGINVTIIIGAICYYLLIAARLMIKAPEIN